MVIPLGQNRKNKYLKADSVKFRYISRFSFCFQLVIICSSFSKMHAQDLLGGAFSPWSERF